MPDLVGKTIGSYRIVEQIGLGGMATVFKAYQPSMDRYVALKVLSTHLAQDTNFIKRFQQEAKIIAKLEHLHILPVYDHGEQDSYLYLVMRFIEAGTLKDRLKQGPLPLDEARRVVQQVGSALEYAHQLGVIHRDMKPSNILIDPQGDCYLTDFGIAKIVEGTLGLTGSGIVGTPHYMAPEQGRSHTVDHRADIYATGVVIYEMVTGQLPYDAETPFAVVMKHMTEPLPLPRAICPDLPEAVERVILRALAKDPADRYQSMRDLVTAFDQAVQTAPDNVLVPHVSAAREQAAAPALTPTVLMSRRASLLRWLAAQPPWLLPAAGLALAVIVLAGVILSRIPGRVEIAGGQLQLVTPTAMVTAIPGVAVTATPSTTHTPASAPTATPIVPTSTPNATPTANPAVLAAYDVYSYLQSQSPTFVDDFGKGGNWDLNFSPQYRDGRLYVPSEPRAPGSDNTWQAAMIRPFSSQTLAISVDFRFSDRGGFDSNCAVEVEEDRGEDYIGKRYLFLFRADNRVWLNRDIKLNFTTIGTSRRDVADFSQFNNATIIVQGDHFTVFVNGELALMATDSTEPVTFVELNLSAIGAICEFDNFRAWDLTGYTFSAPTPIPSPSGRVTDAATAMPTPTRTHTPTAYPTSIPRELFVPANAEGVKFVAEKSGIHRFTTVSGAILNCPPGANPADPFCGTWTSYLMIYKNRQIEWRPNPSGWDYSVGKNRPVGTAAQAETEGEGSFVDIPLKQGQYVFIVANDCRGCYHDNQGGISLRVSVVADLS